MSEYEFQAELTANEFYLEIELIAEYYYTPECKGSRDEYGQLNEPDCPAEIEITLIRPASDKPTNFEIAASQKLNDAMETDKLIDEIFASFKNEHY